MIYIKIIFAGLLVSSTTGCMLAAAGVGAEAAYVGTQENRTMGETLDDQSITASIKTKFLADEEISGFAINIDTYKTVVTLKGRVGSDYEAQKAVKIARNTGSVTKVRSELVVE
jgi:osmotically-inducible protein OsmY